MSRRRSSILCGVLEDVVHALHFDGENYYGDTLDIPASSGKESDDDDSPRQRLRIQESSSSLEQGVTENYPLMPGSGTNNILGSISYA